MNQKKKKCVCKVILDTAINSLSDIFEQLQRFNNTGIFIQHNVKDFPDKIKPNTMPRFGG